MNKKWFITGASSGIGRNLTEQLLEAGNTVFATLRKPELLNDLAEEYPGRLYVDYLELTDLDSIENAVTNAHKRLGQIDIAVSNAGIGVFGAVEELDRSMIIEHLNVNLLGSIMLIKTLIPFLRNQPGGGQIINYHLKADRLPIRDSVFIMPLSGELKVLWKLQHKMFHHSISGLLLRNLDLRVLISEKVSRLPSLWKFIKAPRFMKFENLSMQVLENWTMWQMLRRQLLNVLH